MSYELQQSMRFNSNENTVSNPDYLQNRDWILMKPKIMSKVMYNLSNIVQVSIFLP